MRQAQASERVLIDQFLEALRSLPEVRKELGRSGPADHPIESEHDARLSLDVAGKSIQALVELRKAAVHPRDVRQVVWRIRELAHRRPAGAGDDEALAVLVAESISQGRSRLLAGGLTPRYLIPAPPRSSLRAPVDARVP